MGKPIQSPKDFPWGDVVEDYHVGPYTIRAFHPWKMHGVTLKTDDPDKSKLHYHGYIDNEDASESWPTLDDALAGLIVRRSIGFNHSVIGYHFVAGVRSLAKNKAEG